MEDIFILISEVGFPIAAAIAGGYFIFLTMRFILTTVLYQYTKTVRALVLTELTLLAQSVKLYMTDSM